MNIIEGDLVLKAVTGKLDVIIQACNCLNIMGGGLAKQIRLTFPEVFTQDKKYYLYCKENKIKQVGTIDVVSISNTLEVVNCYTQEKIGYSKHTAYTDINAVESCMKHIQYKYVGSSKVIGIPYKFGCGLGGGDWDLIKEIIDKELAGLNYIYIKLL